MKFRPQGKSLAGYIVLFLIILFFIWRFTRHFNIFAVAPDFEYPINTDKIPEVIQSLSAQECGNCHADFYKEWKTSIHSQAWTDPYFQVDWKFDRSAQICKNCHIPLDKQQEQLVKGFYDSDKWEPIVEPNPDFDADLQHEGVTCAACHLREGKIRGVLGLENTPHPVQKLDNPNEICMQCHLVENEAWDVFFTLPPCGTVAEIQTTIDHQKNSAIDRGLSGEVVIPNKDSLRCVECHMPLKERPLVKDGKVRMTRQHLWRGGHDKNMVKNALLTEVSEQKNSNGQRSFNVTLTNTGAAHYLPTGIPDRHLTIDFVTLDKTGEVLDQQQEIIRRIIVWRPFIFDWSDNRLARWKPQAFQFDLNSDHQAIAVEVIVKYHLVDQKRADRIGYKSKTPLFHELYRQRITL
jgi:hypothetical protein